MFTQLGISNHRLPAHWGVFSSARRVRWVCGGGGGDGRGGCWLSIVIKPPPSLYSRSPATTLLAPSFLSPATAWNRLAPCQGELGLLWLCCKSARKNTNHLFRARSGQGWGCKYRSLAPSRRPSWPHTWDHRVQSRRSCSASGGRAAVHAVKLEPDLDKKKYCC